MGKLLQIFPSRMLDPLYRTQTYVDRRRGMPDPEQERRILRAQGRAPLPVSPETEDPRIISRFGYNPPAILSGGRDHSTYTVTGAMEGSPCRCGHTGINTGMNIVCACNVSSNNSVEVYLISYDGATQNPTDGTLTIIVDT